MNKVTMGTRLKSLRGQRPQKQVADDIGILQSTYCMYENGQRVPSDDVKTRIAKYYNKSVQEIFFAE